MTSEVENGSFHYYPWLYFGGSFHYYPWLYIERFPIDIFCFIKSTYNQQFNLLNQSYATLIHSLNHFVDHVFILLKILSSKLKPHMLLIPTVNSRIVDIGIG